MTAVQGAVVLQVVRMGKVGGRKGLVVVMVVVHVVVETDFVVTQAEHLLLVVMVMGERVGEMVMVGRGFAAAHVLVARWLLRVLEAARRSAHRGEPHDLGVGVHGWGRPRDHAARVDVVEGGGRSRCGAGRRDATAAPQTATVYCR